jgi:hypothetical protein
MLKKTSIGLGFNSLVDYYKNSFRLFTTIIKKFDNRPLREKFKLNHSGYNSNSDKTKLMIEKDSKNSNLVSSELETNSELNKITDTRLSVKLVNASIDNNDTFYNIDLNKNVNNSKMIKNINKSHKNRDLSSLVPKNSPIELLNLDQNTLYKYDTVQLLEIINSIPLEDQNIPKLLYSLTLIRKKRQLKHYESENLVKVVNYLSSNVESMPLSYQVSLFFNLSKMNFFNNDKSIVYNIALSTMKNITYINTPIKNNFEQLLNEQAPQDTIILKQLIPIREVSNFILALSYFIKLKPKEFVFSELFAELENILIMNFLTVKNELLCNYLDTQSFSNIVLAYSKTQNGSREFYSILTEIAGNLTFNKPQELANIVYSYGNNINCDDRMLFTLHDTIVEKINKFQVLELVSVLRAYKNKDLLDKVPELKGLIVQEYLAKFKEANPLDIAHIYSILADEFFEIILKQTNFARKSVYRKRVIKSSTISSKLKQEALNSKQEKKSFKSSKDVGNGNSSDYLNKEINSIDSEIIVKKQRTSDLTGVIVSERIREYLIDKDRADLNNQDEENKNINNTNDSSKSKIEEEKLSKNELLSKSIIMNIKETTTPEVNLLDDIYKLVEISRSSNFKSSKELKNAIKFFEFIHSQIKNLSFAFEATEISLLYNCARIIYDLDSNLYSQLNTHIEHLMKKGKLKGRDIDIIHINIKDLPFKGEYNIFREKLEAYMRKIKYFI